MSKAKTPYKEVIENYLYKDNKKYQIIFKDRITGFMKDEFDTILTSIEMDLMDKVKIGVLNAYKEGITSENEAAMKMVKEGAITSEELIKIEKGQITNPSMIHAYYKALKLFIDVELSAKELKTDLNKEVKNNLDFWKEQDLDYCKNKFQFFRARMA